MTMMAITMNCPFPLRFDLERSAGCFKIGGESTLRACPKLRDLSSAGIVIGTEIEAGGDECQIVSNNRFTSSSIVQL
jgi:hypothetical protein